MQAQGVKLLFYDSAADVLLLDIPSTIPNNFKPFYVGMRSASTCQLLVTRPMWKTQQHCPNMPEMK